MKHKSNTIPARWCEDWQDAVNWALVMHRNFGVKYTVRHDGRMWFVHVPA